MAPSLLLKTAFIRGESDSSDQSIDIRCNQVSVRTDFIVQNIYSYLLECDIDLPEITAESAMECDILNIWKKEVSTFKTLYADTLFSLCSDVNITPENANVVLEGIANELFCEGITWSRIMSLFVFTAELASQNLIQRLSEDILLWLREYVNKSLKKWVNDHGGWEELKHFPSNAMNNNNNIQLVLPEPDEKNGWAKSVFHGAVRVIGTFAQLANITGQQQYI